MPAYQNELVVDFGEVGSRNSKHRFRVRLDARPLAQLIEAVENAHRVYELMLIDRPGDIWAYTSVVLDDLPPGVASRARRARDRFAKDANEHRPAWPEGSMPFPDFDQLFDSTWDEAELEDEAWVNHRDSAVMRAFAQQSLALARAAQQNLVSSDPLLRHLAGSIHAGCHAFCYLDRDIARQRSRSNAPNEPLHTQAFYRQLDHLLSDTELVSVAYRASGDYRVLRMLATEQRRRAQRTGHRAGNALHVGAQIERTVDNEAWDSEIWLFSEGLSHGDLLIDGGQSGTPIKELIETRRCLPGRFVLSVEDKGDIEGFDKEAGDGWALYRRQRPDGRRIALERISDRRRSALGPVLAFSGTGRTLFDYEKAVVVVGSEASESVRATLAVVIAEWQSQGGDPVLIVCGDTKAFRETGCRDVRVPLQDDADEKNLQAWFDDALKCVRPWFDVVMAINAPAWAAEVLARQTARQTSPWHPWIIATPGTERLRVDLTLEGNSDEVLREASQRAKGRRPKLV